MSPEPKGSRRWMATNPFYGLGRQYPAPISEYRSRLEGLGLIRSRWDMLLSPYGRQVMAMVACLVAIGLMLGPIASMVRGYRELSLLWGEAVMPLMLGLPLLLLIMTLTRMMTDLSLTSFGRVLASAIARLDVALPKEACATESVSAAPATVETSGPAPTKPKRTRRKASILAEQEAAPASAG